MCIASVEEILKSSKIVVISNTPYYHKDEVISAMKRFVDQYDLTVPNEPLTEKERDFMNQIAPFVSLYSKEMCREFFEYWVEPSKSGKMRWEFEKTWRLSSRLKRWSTNKFVAKRDSTEQSTSKKYKTV